MGSLLCCIHGDDEDSGQDDLSTNRNHCFRGFVHLVTVAYVNMLQRAEVRPPASSPAHPNSSAHALDDLVPVAFFAPPRPLAFDDPSFSQKRERLSKSLSYSRESGPLERCCNEVEGGREDIAGKPSPRKEGVQFLSESSLNRSSPQVFSGSMCYLSASDEEECCPICLEEYMSENPKIILECFHDFHLGCIYDWMERSEACPVCGKVMMFKDTDKYF